MRPLVTAPISNKEAVTVARAIFNNFVLIYGPMKQLNSDLGTEYKNEVVRELCDMLKIRQNFSTAYYHQTLGTIERNHRVFNEYIRAYITDNIDHWEEYLKYFTFCYNISYNSRLDNKYTPYELIFSRKSNLPYNLLERGIEPIYNVENYAKEAKYRLQHAHIQAKRLIEKSKFNNKNVYDKSAKPLEVKINDEVLLKKEPYNKHQPIYSGPFVVESILNSNLVLKEKNTKQESYTKIGYDCCKINLKYKKKGTKKNNKENKKKNIWGSN